MLKLATLSIMMSLFFMTTYVVSDERVGGSESETNSTESEQPKTEQPNSDEVKKNRNEVKTVREGVIDSVVLFQERLFDDNNYLKKIY